jgi:PPOX class probable F420-dependent enzyme
MNIPEEFAELLSDEKKALLYLATINKDGTPQVTPVWFDTDGTHILINSAQGRVKDQNMRARSSVAVCIADANDPYRYIQIQGRVIEITTEGADNHIDRLCFKYTGREKYPWKKPGEVRVTYKILPIKIDAH